MFCSSNSFSSSSPVLLLCCPLGGHAGREEGDSTAVQAESQVLPRGRRRGADPGHYPQALLPAGEGGDLVRGSLLPPRDRRASGLIRCPGQVWRVQPIGAPAWLPVLRESSS